MGAMAKRVTEMDDDGKVVTYTPTRAMKRSEAKLLPWTPAPVTRAEKIKRALWG